MKYPLLTFVSWAIMFLCLCTEAVHATDFVPPSGAPSYDLPVFNQLLLRTFAANNTDGSNVRLSDFLDGSAFPERIQDSDLVWKNVFEAAYTENANFGRWFEVISDWKSTGGNSLSKVSKTAQLLNVSSTARAGDLIRIRTGGSNVALLVYSGREHFPTQKIKTDATKVCIFYYPFWSSQSLPRLQQNSFPPRFNKALTTAFLKRAGETPPMKPLFKGSRGWLCSPIAGTYGEYYLPLTEWKKSPSAFQIQIVRYKGWFGEMTDEHANTLKDDLLLAVKISDHCVKTLASQSNDERTSELLKLCFNAKPTEARRSEISRLYRAFPLNAVRMMVGYGPNNPLEDSDDPPNARSDTFSTSMIHVWDTHFAHNEYRRAQTLLHEFTHLTGKWGHPGTSSYASIKKNAYAEHQIMATDKTKRRHIDINNDGKKEYVDLPDPKSDSDYSRPIRYSEAVKNPYCYGLFAYWLCK